MNWTLLAAYVLGVLATARAVRLLTADAFPPAAWLRLRWAAITTKTGRWDSWEPLLTCPFCAAPYVGATVLATAIWADVWEPDLGSLSGWWWVLAVWSSGVYLASSYVVRDEPAEEE